MMLGWREVDDGCPAGLEWERIEQQLRCLVGELNDGCPAWGDDWVGERWTTAALLGWTTAALLGWLAGWERGGRRLRCLVGESWTTAALLDGRELDDGCPAWGDDGYDAGLERGG